MARATRSSATQLHSEKDKLTDQLASSRTKSSTKKRKRTSLADNDDHPPQKQLHSDTTIKQENQPDIDDDNITRSKLQNLQLATNVPIDPSDAQQILDILTLQVHSSRLSAATHPSNSVDSQALLDRVFPLPPPDLSEPSTSTSKSGSFSLRALLREPSQHPLRVLRAAVQNLFPISHHTRSRVSSPAAQQLRFCNLACSLLDQASFHSVPLPLDIDTILSDFSDSSSTPEVKPTLPSSRLEKHAHVNQTKKYALMQRLPSGTWWTSLNSDSVPSDSKPLKDLSTANAELVAILPSAPAPAEERSAETSPVTLASYIPKKPPGYKPKLPGPRRVSCGTFLDYGPYASFAPAFDQDGVEVGRSVMGELFCRWEDRKKRWTNEHTVVTQQPSDQVPQLPQPNGVDKSHKDSVLDDEASLEGLFSAEQIFLLKQALGNLELEAAVHELLERNSKALKRLEELQNRRLSEPGKFTPVEEGSEEWDTALAQGILDSLCILMSLRPRSSTSDNAPFTPLLSALHKLQRTLPIAPTQGWHGTLPAEHATALRDDSTLYIKSTATTIPAAPSAPPTQTPTPTQPAPAQATVAAAAATAQAYAGYSYNYATPYRPGYQYKPGQPSPYYPNAYTAQTTAQAQAASQYYQAQPYSATGQQQYTYSSWYQYNPQTQSNTTGGSRKGTPQPSVAAATPAATTPSAMPTSYAGFFSATTQTPGQRAVANTVATATPGGKSYQPAAGGTWTAPAGTSATTGYVAPTLPPHMRSAVASQAGAAGAYNTSLYQPNYYGTYQATSSPAQS